MRIRNNTYGLVLLFVIGCFLVYDILSAMQPKIVHNVLYSAYFKLK